MATTATSSTGGSVQQSGKRRHSPGTTLDIAKALETELMAHVDTTPQRFRPCLLEKVRQWGKRGHHMYSLMMIYYTIDDDDDDKS